MKIAFVDSETTGLHPETDAIIELGIVQVDLNDPTKVQHSVSRYNPGQAAISAGAGMIHGIRNQDLLGLPTFREGGVKQVEPLILTSGIMVAHNVGFDGKFIQQGVGRPWDQKISSMKTFCTMREYGRLFSVARNTPIKLGALSELAAFPYDPEIAHNALYDALACSACFMYGLAILRGQSRANVAHLGLDRIENDIFFEAYSSIIELYESQQWVKRPVEKRNYRSFAVRRSQSTNRISGLLEILSDACSDGVLELAEIAQIQDWLENNKDLHDQWPVSEIKNRLEEVLDDGVITSEEQKSLLVVIEHVVQGKVVVDIPKQNNSVVKNETTELAGKTIVLTGNFVGGEKANIEDMLTQKGMILKKSVTKKVDILLVGSLGSEAYAHGAFGSKFKKAMELQNNGCPIQVIHERDFPLRLAIT